MPLQREVANHEGRGDSDKLRVADLDVRAMFGRGDSFLFRESRGVFSSRIAHV